MTELSPAAQAVLYAYYDAANEVTIYDDVDYVAVGLAAALRAAAVQMATHHSEVFLYSIADVMKLHNLAAELDP